MHYDDKREGTVFSMPTGTYCKSGENAYLGNDREKLKMEGDLYCMHVKWLLLHVFHENIVWKHWWLWLNFLDC